MNLQKLPLLILSIVFATCALAQHSADYNTNIYEFVGRISAQGTNAKGIVIKAFDGDSCFSTFKTKSNGKFVFYGEGKKQFTIQFEKDGYLTKQLIVNTNDIRNTGERIGTHKFEINLERTGKNEKDDQFLSSIDVIEIGKSGTHFTYKSNRNKNDYLTKNTQLASTTR